MQADVNIVYPIDGGVFPKVDPAPGDPVASAYITASFSATCVGGPHDVKWGFDNQELGEGTFYDQFSAQQVWKLVGGKHTFWVKSDCGDCQVRFEIADWI